MGSYVANSIALACLLLGVASTSVSAAAAPVDCSVPTTRLIHRWEIDVPGVTRVTMAVQIPADSEVLVEAYETRVNSRLEVRESGGDDVNAESALHRWPPHRVVIRSGRTRIIQVTVVGLERSHGSVDLRISRLGSGGAGKCADFWRAMASGDAAYARGAMIARGEAEAPPGSAQRAYESALEAYTRGARALGPGSFLEAQIHLVRAAVLMDAVGRFPESMEAAATAERRFKTLGDDYGRDFARFYWAYSLAYDAMRVRDVGEATRKFELAANAFREIAADRARRHDRFGQALALDGLACTDGFLFRFADAISDYQHALEIFEELKELDRAVPIRINLAYFETQFGRFREALESDLEILEEQAAIKDPVVVVSTLRNTAFAEVKLGRYDAALRHYSDAYEQTLRMQSRPEQAWALYGLGNAYHVIGNFGEARAYLERSLELRSDQQRTRDLSLTLRTLANVLSDSGQWREAIARREEALRNSQIPTEKARITLELIEDRITAGDIAIAKSLIPPLLSGTDLPDPAVRASATLASARIALAEGDGSKAAREARGVAEFYRSSELVSSEFAALLVQARAECTSGVRDKALDAVGAALARAEEIRTFSSNPTLRASLWRPVRPAFGFAIALLARAKSCGGNQPADPLGALSIAEESRGRALEDLRRRSSMDSAAQSRFKERRRDLFERLAGIRQQIETLSVSGPANDDRMKALLAEASRLRREIDLAGGLTDSNRHDAEHIRVALQTRMNAMPEDSAAVEYWIGKDGAFAWMITRGRIRVVELGPGEPIDAAARRVADEMRSWISGTVESRIARLRELHRLIIAPLGPELARARTVYFIPDGALHAVPFAALADSGRTDARFFIDAHDVAVAPSFLATEYQPAAFTKDRKAAALVVVDPVYARDDGRFAVNRELLPLQQGAAITLRGSRSWSRLPGTAREAATISRLLGNGGVQVLSGFDANRDILLGRDLSRFDIIHFATHAVADTEAPQLSALVLSTFDAAGKPRVGEVFAGDLADQRLNARLAVLSGCETALGRAEAGEGLLGLRYAAHASGARAVVASLWPVEDAAGARLMDDLYADVISRHEPPVAALSRAARSARARWKDPALWAAFDVSVAGF